MSVIGDEEESFQKIPGFIYRLPDIDPNGAAVVESDPSNRFLRCFIGSIPEQPPNGCHERPK